MAKEACVITARGIGELNMHVVALAEQGYTLVAVLDTHNGDYQIVAQKDDLVDLAVTIHDAVFSAVRSGME